ncbi:DUF2061 domain-containing protein [Sedimenticola hydrogenitrophicus]|uniref:DUF2061 domain-containing protein n=1 Tax=Sedimenticola hydrogenitrophicus TaxID=2967975 RepID=UPI0021A6ABED|nr:DUF2061 domain-containing protein [Sedimenticola hydrogenitrophicus]
MTKTFTFAAVHFSVAFSVAYLLTGSLLVGGAIALVEPAINTVAYHIHEWLWMCWRQAHDNSAGNRVRFA